MLLSKSLHTFKVFMHRCNKNRCSRIYPLCSVKEPGKAIQGTSNKALITCGQLPVTAYGVGDVMFIQYRNISVPCQSSSSPAFIQSPKNPWLQWWRDNDWSVTKWCGMQGSQLTWGPGWRWHCSSVSDGRVTRVDGNWVFLPDCPVHPNHKHSTLWIHYTSKWNHTFTCILWWAVYMGCKLRREPDPVGLIHHIFLCLYIKYIYKHNFNND